MGGRGSERRDVAERRELCADRGRKGVDEIRNPVYVSRERQREREVEGRGKQRKGEKKEETCRSE